MTIDARVAAGTALLGPSDAGELLTLQLAAWVREARENATIEIPPLQEGLADVQAQLVDPALTIWGFREAGRLLATARTSLLADDVAFLGRLGVDSTDQHGDAVGQRKLRLHAAGLVVANHRFDARGGECRRGEIGLDAIGKRSDDDKFVHGRPRVPRA